MLALRPSRSSTPLLHQIPFAAMFKLLVTLSEVYILSKQVAELKTHLVPMTVAQLRSTASIIIKIHANIWLLSITLTLSHHQPNPFPPLSVSSLRSLLLPLHNALAFRTSLSFSQQFASLGRPSWQSGSCRAHRQPQRRPCSCLAPRRTARRRLGSRF